MGKSKESIKNQPKHWLDIAKQINLIAQTGLAFTNDKYDKERYEKLLDLSLEILQNIRRLLLLKKLEQSY